MPKHHKSGAAAFIKRPQSSCGLFIQFDFHATEAPYGLSALHSSAPSIPWHRRGYHTDIFTVYTVFEGLTARSSSTALLPDICQPGLSKRRSRFLWNHGAVLCAV